MKNMYLENCVGSNLHKSEIHIFKIYYTVGALCRGITIPKDYTTACLQNHAVVELMA